MNSQPPKLPSPKPEPGNLDASELASNQEAKPIPWMCGARKIALTWVAPISGLVAKKLVSPPPGISNALGIAAWFDLGAATLFGADQLIGKGNDNNRPTTTAYYGTVVGVVGVGPFDELTGVLINSAVVWPTNKTWADGVINIPTASRSRQGNVAFVKFAVEHGLRKGQKFVMSGLSDASFNEAAPTTITAAGSIGIKYANVGANVASTNDTGGLLTKVVHYEAGDLVKDGAAIWECTADHDGTIDKRPGTAGGAAYWTRYVVDRGSNPNPFPFTIPNFCEAAYWYWGTSNQTLDAAGEAFLSQTGHPPYRRQGVLVLKKCLLGTRPAAPNIEVIVRRKPNQTLIGGASAAIDADGQANPVAAFAELATDAAFGIGRPAGALDAVTFQAIADELQALADKMYISPILLSQITFRAFVSTLVQYYDGWFRFNASGVIEAGRFLHNAAPPAFDDTTTLDFNDATEEIGFEADGWAETFNEVLVKFQDFTRAYKDAVQKSYSGFNRQVVGEPRLTALERPWISREAQALAHAAESVNIYSEPTMRGSIEVRKEKATHIKHGDLFLLTHDAAQLSVICRAIQKGIVAPPAGRARMSFERERGIAVLPFQATGTPVTHTVPEDEDLSLSQIVQPPPALSNAVDFRICVLAARKSLVTHGFHAWFKQEDADFYDLGQQVYFAVKGTLAQNYSAPAAKATVERSRNANVATIKATAHGYSSGLHVNVSGLGGAGYNVEDVVITVTDANHFTYPNVAANEGVTADANGVVNPASDDESETLQFNPDDFQLQDDLDRVSATQTADAINDDALLVWVFKADLSASEIMTLREIRLDAGVYKLKVRRGRFGTAAVTFSTNDIIWLFYRSDLVFFNHVQFADYAQSGTAATFRLQAFTASGAADLTDADLCPDIAFNFADSYSAVASFPDTLQERADQDSDFADVSSTGARDPSTQFHMVVRFDSPSSVVSGELDAVNGVQRIKLWSVQAQVVQGSWQSSVIFSLPSGNWFFDLTAIDQFGRVTKTRYTSAVGEGDPIYILTGGSSRHVGTITSPASGTYEPGVLAVSIIDPTLNGLIVRKYSLVNLGAAPGAYTNGNSVNITIAPGSGKTLYTKQTLAGVDSLVRRDDYIAAS